MRFLSICPGGWRLFFAWGMAVASVTDVRAQADGSPRWAFTTLSTATTGTIVSSPAQGPDGTIYVGVEVGSSSSTTASGRLFALNANGTPKWAAPFTAPDWIDSTPAVAADGTVYFGCWNGYLYALRSDGAKAWEFKAGSFIASSPAIAADGTIYVGAGSNLVAVNPNGTLKWSFPAADWIDSSPAVATDGTIYVGSWDNNLYAVRPDGTEKWRFTTDDNVSTSPAIGADGTVYFGSRDVKLYAVTPAGTLKWSFDTGDTIEASPALGADGTIYVGTNGGRLFAISPEGAARWRYPAATQPALAAITSTAAVRADGSVVFGSSNNALYALRGDGTLLWRSALGDATDASPLVAADGTIYIGAADKKIYAFNGSVSPLTNGWAQFRRDGRRAAAQPFTEPAGPGAPGAGTPTAGRLINLSVRTFAGAGDSTLIVGFVVGGSGGRALLLRGVGPTLGSFGVTGALANPRLTAVAGPAALATNDDWGAAGNVNTIASTAAAVGAFALPAGSLDAALLSDFSAGAYTVQVAGAGGATGVGLMEAYDAGGASAARLVNVSARSTVGTGAGILIAGFVVGDGPRTVLIRGVGPALATFGVSGALANPQLQIFQGSQLVAENDNWGNGDAAALAASAQRVGAFALPNGSADAAILVTLPPNAYTVQLSGVNGTTGVALVEVYEVP